MASEQQIIEEMQTEMARSLRTIPDPNRVFRPSWLKSMAERVLGCVLSDA